MEPDGITELLPEEFNPVSLFKNLNEKLEKGQYFKCLYLYFIYTCLYTVLSQTIITEKLH